MSSARLLDSGLVVGLKVFLGPTTGELEAPTDAQLAGGLALAREHGLRPAIDPLFRSAAATAGPRTIGVLLSGVLDDGVAGLSSIRTAGGTVIVQDPETAAYPDMPLAAISQVDVDHVADPQGMPALLRKCVDSMPSPLRDRRPEPAVPLAGAEEATMDPEGHDDPDVYSCPACSGPLVASDEAAMLRFRCRIGHVWSQRTLVAEQSQALEDALWTALRALEDKATLSRRLSSRAHAREQERTADRFAAHARTIEERAAIIRGVLDDVDILTADPSSAASVD
jgi:two-component system, chemotaxis family, protein-glutamate methylesterase/glutaminase